MLILNIEDIKYFIFAFPITDIAYPKTPANLRHARAANANMPLKLGPIAAGMFYYIFPDIKHKYIAM